MKIIQVKNIKDFDLETIMVKTASMHLRDNEFNEAIRYAKLVLKFYPDNPYSLNIIQTAKQKTLNKLYY